MGRDEHAHPTVCLRPDPVPQPGTGQGFDPRGRFVEHQHVGAVLQGAHECQLPAKAEREGGDERVRLVGQCSLEPGRLTSERLGREGEVLGHCELGVQTQALWNIAEAATALPGRRCPVQEGLPGSGPGQPEQHPDGGGLAGAVGPEQADDLTGVHVQGDVIDRGEVPEPLGEPSGLDQRAHDVRPSRRDATMLTSSSVNTAGTCPSGAPSGHHSR